MSGSRPTVSVVIPSFNAEGWLPGTVLSLLEQEIPPDEVIVVDDGSTDGTAAIASSFGAPVKLVRRPNGGLGAARNTGTAHSSGDLIMFLDADDRLVPDALAVLLDLHDRYPGAGAYVPNHRELWSDGPRLSWPDGGEPKVLTRADLGGVFKRNWLRANCLVPKAVAEAFPFHEHMLAIEDFLFFSDLLLAGRAVVVSGRPGVEMAVKRPGSLTAQAALMRRSRRRAYESLLIRGGLSARERALLNYGVVKASFGEAAAMRGDRDRLAKTADELAASQLRYLRGVARVERLLFLR